MSIEVYVRDTSVAEACAWVEKTLGALERRGTVGGVEYLVSSSGTAVVITPSIEDGPFLSIFINGEDYPWTSSGALAQQCAAELGRTVRWCDEETNGFMEQSGNGPAVAILLD